MGKVGELSQSVYVPDYSQAALAEALAACCITQTFTTTRKIYNPFKTENSLLTCVIYSYITEKLTTVTTPNYLQLGAK